MPELERRLPAQLSGGQQQRVALARALATRSPLLLLDEPLSNLDEKLRTELRHDLRGLFSRVGAGVLLITHDQREALALAHRVAREQHLARVHADRKAKVHALHQDMVRFSGHHPSLGANCPTQRHREADTRKIEVRHVMSSDAQNDGRFVSRAMFS